jgi:hypothetical protein
MKNFILLFYSFCFFSPLLYAQQPALVWAKKITSGHVRSRCVAVDATGNVYTTGFTSQQSDIFISKVNAAGNFIWSKQMGTQNSIQNIDDGNSIAVDGSGNVYITGFFGGTIDIDPGPGTFTLTDGGIFAAKFDSAGNFLWAKQTYGYSWKWGYSIAVDAAGSAYVTGFFDSTVDFDPGPGIFNLKTAGKTDVFIWKLDAAGNFVWARNMGGTLKDIGSSIAVDDAGNVYTAGAFNGTADFDPGPGTFNLTAAGDYDVFISKLNASGNFIWAKRMGGSNRDEGYSIKVDGSGNVYTTGYVDGTIDYDPKEVTNYWPSWRADIFIAKLDASGNFSWVKNIGGSSGDIGFSLALDAARNVYATGFFQKIVDFDPGPGITNLTAPLGKIRNDSISGFPEIFISKLDTAGNLIWAKNIGGSLEDYGTSIVVDSSGYIHMTGYFRGTADFDPSPAVYSLTTPSTDIFTMKLSQSQSLPTFLDNDQIVLNANCSGIGGNISIIPTSGVAPFVYSIDSGHTYVAGPNGGYTFLDLSAGIYRLRLKDASGSESHVVERQVKASRPIFLNNDQIILAESCAGGDGNISIIPTCGAAPFMYSIDGGNTYIPASDRGYTFMNITAGLYQLRLKDRNGIQSDVIEREVKKICNSTASTSVSGFSTTSAAAELRSTKGSNMLTVYPNPSTGLFTLRLQNFISEKAEVYVFDAKGILIQKRSLNGTTNTSTDFDLSRHARGVYYIKILSKGGTKVSKVLIK